MNNEAQIKADLDAQRAERKRVRDAERRAHVERKAREAEQRALAEQE